jgi:hypothetical protein
MGLWAGIENGANISVRPNIIGLLSVYMQECIIGIILYCLMQYIQSKTLHAAIGSAQAQ